MRFVREENALVGLISNPRSALPRKCDLSSLLILPSQDLEELLSITTLYLAGKKYTTQTTIVRLGPVAFGTFLSSDVSGFQKELPQNFYGWQFLIFQFGLWYISQPNSKASLESQCSSWRFAVVPWLSCLQEAGFIPLGIIWPDMRLPHELGGSNKHLRLVGEPLTEFVGDGHKTEKPAFDNTLAGPIFWHTDNEYLDGVEYSLRRCDEILSIATHDYWTKLVRDYRTGKNLLKKVTEDDWLREEANEWRIKLAHQDRFLIAPGRPDGHIWALRFFNYHLLHSDDPTCLTRSKLSVHKALPKKFLNQRDSTPASPLYSLSALDEQQGKLFTYRHMFNRFSGILNALDFSVAMAILIREHPNWNPASLAGAKLLNSNGKYHLIITDDSASQIFSVDKPRARKRKYAVISKRARQVLRHLLRATQPIRDLLRRSGSPYWRYLFLGDMLFGQLGHPSRIRPDLLNGGAPGGVTLPELYPSLSQAGLNPATLNFARIRNTQGVLEWFDTGSIRAVSKRLGNTERSVLNFYIPESLLAAWNERIVRRFQNVILSLASHDEDWAFDVLDMPNIAELNRFLAQLVYEFPAGASPIGDKVQEYFGRRFRVDQSLGEDTCTSNESGQLHVRLSPNTFALLLAYRKWGQINLSPASQEHIDPETGLAPKHFIDLAGMMKAAAEGANLGDHLRASIDVAKLQRCYEKAIPLVSKIFARLKACSIHAKIEGLQS